MIKLFSAPIQGFTDCAWRNIHSSIFTNSIDQYYAPFLRIEKGAFRNKDIRDITQENNLNYHLVPQIIACPIEEFSLLVEKVISMGFHEIDINMGCPFPPIVKRHCGAGILHYPDEVAALMQTARNFKNVKFSIKMRLGIEDPDEWHDLIPIISSIDPIHVTMHPRTARQQYGGEVNMPQFEQFYSEAPFPVVYNGDIHSDKDIKDISTTFPQLHAIMIGRGLLANPSLGSNATNAKLQIIKFHDKLFQYYAARLSGNAHILTKMKSLWEYFLLDTGERKARKKILRSSTIEKYISAVNEFWPTVEFQQEL